MNIDGPSRRLKRLQWTASALCAASITINYIDRGTIAIANLDIRHTFGLDATAMGALISAWSFAYALSQLPSGFLIDRVGARWLLGAALFLWSAAQAAGGMALSFTQLLMSRAALGVTEAPAYPSAARVTSQWYHPRSRGLPTGVYTGSSVLAPAVAPPILTALMLAFGWRVMFIAVGGCGIVASVLWVMLYRDVRDAALPAAELAHLGPDATRRGPPMTLRQWARLFRFRTIWGLILGSFGLGYVFWMYFGWLPAFLEMQYHISIARTGFLSALPWIGGVAGALLGGYFSDVLARRGFDAMACRKIPTVGGLIAMALFTAAAAMVNSAPLALCCIFLVVFSGMVSTTGLWSLVTVATPKNSVASAASIPNCGAYLGATCSPIITGLLVDLTGSFVAALLTGAAVGLVCSGFYVFLVRQPVPDEDGDSELLPQAEAISP